MRGGVVNGAAVRPEFTSRGGSREGREEGREAERGADGGAAALAPAPAAGGGGEGGKAGGREGRGAPPAGANKGRGERWGWDSAGREGRRRPHHHAAGRPRPAEQVRERGVLQEAEPRVRGEAAEKGFPPPPLSIFPYPPSAGKVSPEGPGGSAAPRLASPLLSGGEAQSVRSAAPLSPGLAPPDLRALLSAD